jgi:hypothetical protein
MSALLTVSAFAAVARAEDAPKALGEWKLKIMTDDGQSLQGGLKLTQEDGKIKGLFTGPDGTEVKTEEITAKGEDLAVKVVLDFQGTELVAKFKLKATGDTLKGNVEYDLGGQTGTLDVVGERKAAGGKIDEGTWDLEIKTDDGQSLKAAVKLSKDGDKLGGKFVGVDGTEAKVTDAAVKDGELAFKVTLDFQGSELVAKFKLKAADAGAKGTVDYDLGGQTGSLDVVAKRPAAAAGGAIGKWDMEVVTADGQSLKSTIKLDKDGDKVVGKFTASDGKEVKLEDLKLEGDNLAFTINLDFEGTALNAKFKGKVEGDNYKGAVDYDLAGQTGTLDFKGKRASGDSK